MKIAYADPPYPGCAKLYKDHPDYAGEVDHEALGRRLETEYDGYILHTSSPAYDDVRPFFPSARMMIWNKSFAAFKRNVSVAYAFEPVLVRACRKPVVTGRVVMRDWFCHPITLKKGLCGAKPPPVVRWLFEMVGAQPEDTLDDLYPGTGIVSRTWEAWKIEVTKGAEAS